MLSRSARKGALGAAGVSVAPGRTGAAGAAVGRDPQSLVRGGPGGHVGGGGWSGRRPVDCGGGVGVMSGREVVLDGGRWTSAVGGSGGRAAGEGRKPLFGFSEVEVSVSDTGVVSYGKGPGSHKVKRFEVRDPAQYELGMTEATAGLLSSLGRKGDPASR